MLWTTLYFKEIGLDTTQKTTLKTTQKTTQKLSKKQEEILAYLKLNPAASRKELTMHIDDLMEDGVKYNLTLKDIRANTARRY